MGSNSGGSAPATPSLKSILNLINAIQSAPSVAKSSASANLDPSAPGALAASEGNTSLPQFNSDMLAMQQGRVKSYDDLPYDVKQLIASTASIKGSTGPIHQNIFDKIGHAVEHPVGQALSRVGDVLSRGDYAVANAAKAFEDKATSSAADQGSAWDTIKALGKGIEAAPGAALKGAEGKQKTRWSDVLQNIEDVKHFQNLGETNQQAVKDATLKPGSANIGTGGKIANVVAGLIGDVALDPTTYVGGVPLKAIAKDAVDTAKVSKLADLGEKLGVTDETGSKVKAAQISNMLGGDGPIIGKAAKTTGSKIFVKAKDALTEPQAEEKIKAIKATIGDYTKQYSDKLFEAAQDEAKKSMEPLVSDADEADKAAYDFKIRKTANDLLEHHTGFRYGEPLETHIRKELLRPAYEALKNPSVTRSVGITFSKKVVATVPLEKALGKVDSIKAGNSTLSKAMNGFDKTFRNSAGVNKELNAIKLRNGAEPRVHALNNFLRKTYSGVGLDDRKRALTAWRGGLDNIKIRNDAGHDINDYFSQRVKDIQDSTNHSTLIPQQINRFLPDKFKVTSFSKNKVFNPDWLHDHIRDMANKNSDPDLRDPAAIIHAFNMAHEKAVARRSMFGEVANTFGHLVKQPVAKFGSAKAYEDRVTRHLIDEYGYKKATVPGKKFGTVKDIPGLEDHVFDPHIADGISKLAQHLDDPGADSRYIKMFDKALYDWKNLVTKYNPGYHERNLYGETFNNWLAGVKNAAVYSASRKVLSGRDREFLSGPQMESATRADIKAGNTLDPDAVQHALSKPGSVAFKRVIHFNSGKTIRQNISPDLAWHLYLDNGLHTGFITSDLDPAIASSSRVGKILGRMNQKMQGVTENIEDYARMAHFIDLLQKSKIVDPVEAAKAAAVEVRKYHFDYSDFTKFEKQVMSRVFPFYKWTRKNIPLMLEMTLAQPGKISTTLKSQIAISNLLGYKNNNNTVPTGDYIMPNWLKQDMATPIGDLGGKNTTYIDPPLPWQQALEAIQSPKQTTGQMLNPLLQLGSQYFTGKTLTGQPTQGANKTFANQTPMTGLVYNLLTGKDQGKSNNTTLAQFLTGLGLQENTPNREKAEAKREQTIATSTRKKYEQQQGLSKTTNHPGYN